MTASSSPSTPSNLPSGNSAPLDSSNIDIFAISPEEIAVGLEAYAEKLRQAEVVGTPVIGNTVQIDTKDIEIQTAFEKHGGLYVGGIRVPSYADRYFVFDITGRQMFNDDGTPKDIRKMAVKVGKADPNSDWPTMKTIDGKNLVPDTGKQRTTRSVVAGYLLKKYDAHYYLQAADSRDNAQQQKLVQEVTGTGPDEQERLLTTYMSQYVEDAQGNWSFRAQNYTGAPLSKMQVVIAKEQIKIAKVDKARALAVIVYELGKREEQEQAGENGAWTQAINFMHKVLLYDEEDIQSVINGIQFIKKGTYLTFKWRKLELIDSEGRPIDKERYTRSQLEKMQKNGETSYRFGKLDERGYAIELADKVEPYRFTFGASDVAEVARLSRRIEARLDEYSHDKNGREYQNAAFILGKLKKAVDATRMAAPTEPGKDGPDPQQFDNERRLQAEKAGVNREREYDASISGPSTAKHLWRTEVASTVDRASAKHTISMQVNVDLEYSGF